MVAIVKYNAGNVQSLKFALERLGVDTMITDDSVQLKSADKVIFPGQGEASSAMKYLKNKSLDRVLVDLEQPFLGICLGMQLMCRETEENDTQCLGILPLTVRKFKGDQKIPHMGWNQLVNPKGVLFNDVRDGEHLYFVHSYYVELSEPTTASCVYGTEFSASVQKDNFYAVQAHPEKSAETGMKILKNFLSI